MDVGEEPSTCSLPGDALQPLGFLLHPKSPEVTSALCRGTQKKWVWGYRMLGLG